jgi:tripartite-type tricarboxylate transporter receptor subunit TctC
MPRNSPRLAILLLTVLLAAPAVAQAPYPNRSIKLLVPIPPGGAPDVTARLIGHYLSESLGQPVVVENRTGANGNIAADAVAKAEPDGYTLLLAADSGITINPHVYARLPFDPLKDLVPVASVAANQFMLAVNPKVPAKNFREFIDYARAADPPLAYASGGNGSQHQLAMEMLKARAGIKLLHVPYRGGSPAATATIAGETQVFFAGAASSGQFEAGQLRPLAASGQRRSKRYPHLPTIGEFYPGYAIDIWLGLFAPAGTPAPIVAKLHDEVHRLLARPEVAEKMNVSGSLEPLILSPVEFSDLIRRDYEKYGKLVREIGIKLD